MVLVSTSVTALLVRSTFCRREESPVRISSGIQPIPQQPRGDFGDSSGSPLTFSISLKSSSNLVPSAPPTFSLTSCGERTRGEDQALTESSHPMEKIPGRERGQGLSTQHLQEKGGGRNSPKPPQKTPPNSQKSLSTQSWA